MKKVSIILLANEDYLKNRYCYETALSKIEAIEIQLLVGNLNSDNTDKSAEFFKLKINDKDELTPNEFTNDYGYKWYPKEISETKVANDLMRFATGEYICILKPTTLLDEHWLSDLIHYYESVDRSGVISISDGFENLSYLPLISEGDKFVNVMQPDVSWIKDLCFFKREFLNHVGCFDEEIENYDNALKQLCLRFTALGYNNYYIPSQTCVKVNSAKGIDVIQDKKENQYIANSLVEMKQRKSYYLPLR